MLGLGALGLSDFLPSNVDEEARSRSRYADRAEARREGDIVMVFQDAQLVPIVTQIFKVPKLEVGARTRPHFGTRSVNCKDCTFGLELTQVGQKISRTLGKYRSLYEKFQVSLTK